MFNLDNTMISPELQRIFERVRDGADFMPLWQLEVIIIFILNILILNNPLHCIICMDD